MALQGKLPLTPSPGYRKSLALEVDGADFQEGSTSVFPGHLTVVTTEKQDAVLANSPLPSGAT